MDNSGQSLKSMPFKKFKSVGNYSDGVLFIPEVMEKVFSYMDLPTLLACRETCHEWKDWTRPFVGKKTKIDLIGVLKFPEPHLELMVDRVELPFRMNMPSLVAELKGFLGKYGFGVTEVMLDIPSKCTAGELVDFLQYIGKAVPNLKYLELSGLEVVALTESTYLDDSVDFDDMKNLKWLKLHFARECYYTDGYNLMTTFIGQILIKLCSLEEVYVDITHQEFTKRTFLEPFFFNTRVVELLVELNINLKNGWIINTGFEVLISTTFPKLKDLTIKAATTLDTLFNDGLYLFMLNVRKTLESLVLQVKRGPNPSLRGMSSELFYRPCLMEKLKTFACLNIQEGVVVSNLGCCLKNMPKVEQLHIKGFNSWGRDGSYIDLYCVSGYMRDERPMWIGNPLRYPKIRDLKISGPMKWSDPNLAAVNDVIQGHFPNLKTLKLHVSLDDKNTEKLSGLLRILSKGKLTHLELKFRSVDIITRAKVQMLNESLEDGLCAFNCLQKLTLKFKEFGDFGPICLSECVGTRGICKMDNLTTLCLVGFFFKSAVATKRVREKLALLDVQRDSFVEMTT